MLYLDRVLDGVGHDQLLDRQLADQLLKLLVGAQTVEAEAVDVFRPLALQVPALLSDRLPAANHVCEQDHISPAHLLPQVVRVVVEAHPAAIVEQPEGLPELRH